MQYHPVVLLERLQTLGDDFRALIELLRQFGDRWSMAMVDEVAEGFVVEDRVGDWQV